MLSVIITADLQRRPMDIFNKLIEVVKSHGINFEIIIAHHDRKSQIDFFFKSYFRDKCNLISIPCQTDSICNSLLRNVGAKHATFDIIALYDADLFMNKELLIEQARTINNQNHFVMLPCFYLTQHASKQIKRKPNYIYDKCIQADRRFVQHLASPSSALILNKKDYFKIGGFDEQYLGHGYEDFDFMIHLANHYDLIQLNDYSLEDKPYKAPIFATGFRQQLSLFSLIKLIENKAVFHLYHRNNKTCDQYYTARKANQQRFNNKVSSLVKKEISTTKDSLERFNLLDFLLSVTNTPEDYPILFDCRRGHLDRVDTIRRKLRYTMGL